mgnify:FL=1
MSGHNISTFWTCECDTTNPLRKRNCTACGRRMPDDFLNKIYKEEISVHKLFFKGLSRKKEIAKCEKIGGVLAKIQGGTVVCFILLFFVCNGTRFYFYPETISDFKKNYVCYRESRIADELHEFSQELANIKKVSDVLGQVLINAWDSAEDVREGLSKDSNHGSINEEKVNHIAERITEAINYVTGKLR